MKEKALEILLRYIGNSKEASDALDELIVLFDVLDGKPLQQEIKSRREQISDINQWSTLLMKNRLTLRERVLWSMIADIHNRTSD